MMGATAELNLPPLPLPPAQRAGTRTRRRRAEIYVDAAAAVGGASPWLLRLSCRFGGGVGSCRRLLVAGIGFLG